MDDKIRNQRIGRLKWLLRKTKNGTYQLKLYVPTDIQGKLGLGQYYEKAF